MPSCCKIAASANNLSKQQCCGAGCAFAYQKRRRCFTFLVHFGQRFQNQVSALQFFLACFCFCKFCLSTYQLSLLSLKLCLCNTNCSSDLAMFVGLSRNRIRCNAMHMTGAPSASPENAFGSLALVTVFSATWMMGLKMCEQFREAPRSWTRSPDQRWHVRLKLENCWWSAAKQTPVPEQTTLLQDFEFPGQIHCQLQATLMTRQGLRRREIDCFPKTPLAGKYRNPRVMKTITLAQTDLRTAVDLPQPASTLQDARVATSTRLAGSRP